MKKKAVAVLMTAVMAMGMVSAVSVQGRNRGQDTDRRI